MATVSSVTTGFFPTAKEGFTTTLASTISSGATTVPLNSVSGFSNGEYVVLVVDPTDATKKQAFTGQVDTSGVQITNVVWTEGTNTSHTAGATVVDYETATHWALYRKGLLVSHNEDGTMITSLPLTTPKITTSINDSNGNEVIKTPATSSAVNELTVTNAATGNAPQIAATGGDTNIDLKLLPKGTGRIVMNGAGAPVAAAVATSQTTTSTSYTDLSTAGPEVTATIGASGIALVIISGALSNSGANYTNMSFAVSGANTQAASDAYSHNNKSTDIINKANVFLLTGLNAGSTTFTAKYSVLAGTGTFSNRRIAVIPL